MKKENLFLAIAVAAIIYLFFVWGALAVQLKIFPYSFIEKQLIGMHVAFKGVNQLEDDEAYADEYRWPIFAEYYQQDGVTVHKDKAYAGYTLFAVANEQAVRLIDMDGQLVHKWDVNPKNKFETPEHMDQQFSYDFVVPRDAYLYPNGDILVVLETKHQYQNNYGVAKFDKNSEPIWLYKGRNHHYLDVAPNGDIYTLASDIHKDYLPYKGLEHLKYPSFEDFVEIIDKDGALKKRVSIFRAFENSNFKDLLFDYIEPQGIQGDHVHPNTAHYITAEAAENSPLFEEGQVMVSLRNIDTIAVIDMELESVVWAAKGFWARQHYTQLLPNGNISLYDNKKGRVKRKSRIIEFNPVTGDYVWTYAGEEKKRFYSAVRGQFQFLGNGNVLATAHGNGRLFEVNRQGELVWEYFMPLRDIKDANKIGSAYIGKRYTRNQLPFILNKKE